MLKILLCYPPVAEAYNKIRDAGLTPHLSTLCIACHLRKCFPDISVRILDGHHLSMAQIEVELDAYDPDLVGYSVDFTNYENAVELSRYAKHARRDVWNVMGSNHATNLWRQILQNRPEVDFVSLCDGEPSWEDLVRLRRSQLTRREARNLAFLDPDTGEAVRTREERLDLADMADVDYSLIDLEPYFAIQRKVMGENFRMLQFTSQRGCVNKPLCVFCGRYTDGIRFRDPERYAKEIAYWAEKLDLTEVWDRSDSFIQHAGWLKRFCQVLGKYTDRFRTGKTTFKTYARADQLLSGEVIDRLKQLNFRMVFIGYEAGDDRILTNIGKHANLKVYRQATKNVLQGGLDIDASFIVGLPGENRESLENHKRFVRELVDMGLDKIRVNRLLVLPGTPLYSAVMRNFPELSGKDVIRQELLQRRLFETDLYDLTDFGGDPAAFEAALSQTAAAMTGAVLEKGGGAEGYGYGKNRNILAGKQLQGKHKMENEGGSSDVCSDE